MLFYADSQPPAPPATCRYSVGADDAARRTLLYDSQQCDFLSCPLAKCDCQKPRRGAAKAQLAGPLCSKKCKGTSCTMAHTESERAFHPKAYKLKACRDRCVYEFG